jgi:hypothetical protein
MGETTWVVLSVTHPSWMNPKVPKEVADLLHIHPPDIVGLPKPSRSLALVEWGPRTVRVLNGRIHAGIVAKETLADRVLGQVTLNETLIFRIPPLVAAHLGVEAFARRAPGTLGTRDMIAWIVPEDQYTLYRDATADGSPFRRDPRAPPLTVCLVKAHFPGLRPPSGEIEKAHGWETRMRAARFIG